MINTSDFRKGKKLEIDNIPYEIIDFQHSKVAGRQAHVKTKLRNLIDKSVVEKTFSSNEKFKQPDCEEKKMQFLYKSGESYSFMCNETFEQTSLSKEQLDEAWKYLAENIEINILFFNQNPIGVTLPVAVLLKVVETDPSFKGNTVTGGKPAKLETGATISVPFFIEAGEIVKVDTRNGKYLERGK